LLIPPAIRRDLEGDRGPRIINRVKQKEETAIFFQAKLHIHLVTEPSEEKREIVSRLPCLSEHQYEHRQAYTPSTVHPEAKCSLILIPSGDNSTTLGRPTECDLAEEDAHADDTESHGRGTPLRERT
jgi:hypothetical protein